jgi:hypothetical protein
VCDGFCLQLLFRGDKLMNTHESALIRRSPLPGFGVSAISLLPWKGEWGVEYLETNNFSLALYQEIWYHNSALRRLYKRLEASTLTWGCRVSTDEQVEELQVEVSVRTLVKQPTNHRCQTGTQLRSRCLRNSKRRPPNFLLWGWCWASTT